MYLVGGVYYYGYCASAFSISRQEEVIESKVMLDMTKLFNRLLAVNDFLSNVHTCLFNYLVGKYKRGELVD